ncbi:LysR family transcriptional regulator [Streptomyces sp. HNM0574]|uniref:LysR family transcriptional regulator n=1 Tax=Streptomyces sp. HNM0574 TaxID=2714954 RepID=UPI00146D5222|nr:LysR family transcriptional regulator [Streptomyces sp. HNM0574]NLU68802.1 LysR family transcriptional regulator [Streptomyces sp. HNM0574]
MELRQLEFFLAVVEHEGLNRAAQRLYVSQPTLSQAIQSLERELGVSLFHRAARRSLTLTSAGTLLVPKARAVLDGVVAARDAMSRARDVRSGSVAIGTMPEMSSDAVASWITSFRSRHPDVRLDVAESPGAGALCAEVVAGRRELGFTTRPVPEDGLDFVELGVQRLLLVMPPGSPAPEDGRLPLDAVGGLPLTVCALARRENDRVCSALREFGVEPRLTASMPNRHAQLTLVLGGGVHAFLPLRMAVQARRLGAVVVETDPVVSVPFGIVHRHAALSPAAEELVHECQTTLTAWYTAIDHHRTEGTPLLDAADRAYGEVHPTARGGE